jgi:hypothetical protein
MTTDYDRAIELLEETIEQINALDLTEEEQEDLPLFIFQKLK